MVELLIKLFLIFAGIILVYVFGTKRYSKKTIFFLIVLFAILGFFANVISNSFTLFTDRIDITALNKPGASSNSSQIFIRSFTIDGTEYPVREAAKGNWLWAGVDNNLYAWLPKGHPGRTTNITDSITISIPEGNERTIHFLKDKYCGFVQINVSGRKQIVDTSISDSAEIGASNVVIRLARYALIMIILASAALAVILLIRTQIEKICRWFDKNVNAVYNVAIQRSELKGFQTKKRAYEFQAGNTLLSIWESISKQNKITFFSVLVLGVMIHLYMLTNKLPNPDDLMHMFNLGEGTVGGRWSLDVLGARIPILDTSILPLYSMPWFNGLLSIILIGLAACFTVNILKIKNTSSCILVAGIMISFPTVAATFQYMFTAPAYFLALVFAALSVYLALNYKYGFFASALILCFVLGIYQAYFCYAVALFVVSLLLECLDYHSRTTEIVLKGFKYLGTLILAVAFYFITVKISLAYFNVQLTSYAGINEMGHISFPQIFKLVQNAYKQFFLIPNVVVEMADVRKLILIVSGLCSVLNLIYLFLYRKIYREPFLPLIAVTLTAMIPLACESIYLTNAQFYHELMIYPMVLPTVLTIALAENYGRTLGLEMHEQYKTSAVSRRYPYLLKRIFYYFPLLLSLALIINFAIITNEEYLAEQVNYQQAYSYLNRLATRIEETKGYTYDMPVAFIGNINNKTKPPVMTEFKSLTGLIGFNFDGDYPFENALLKNERGINWYMLKEYLGVVIKRATEKQSQDIMLTDGFKSMLVYPQDGSIQVINGILVVKFEQQ